MLLIPIIVYGYLIEKNLTKPIGRLSEITSGKISNREDYLIHKRNLNSINVNNELKILIDSLHAMENDLIEYSQKLIKVTSENERYATELKLASDIQNSMIPKNFEEFCNSVNENNGNEEEYSENSYDLKLKEEEYRENSYDLKLWGLMEAKLEVGGDFYDYFQIDDENIGFVIGDVSGKGITAALIMVKAMTLIRDYAKQYSDISKVFYEVNNLLCEDNAENHFVTAWLGKINMQTGELSFVNAGHNPPLLRLNNENKSFDNCIDEERENNGNEDKSFDDCIDEEMENYGSEFEYMDIEPGLVLAVMEDMPYKTYSVQLGKKDTILLYTDGVTEANYNYEGFYGEERLKDILNLHKDDDLSLIIDSIDKDIMKFCKHESRYDDTTMLIVRLD